MRFQLAAEPEIEETDEPKLIEIELGESLVIKSKYPTPGQSSLLMAGLAGRGTAAAVSAIYRFLEIVLVDNGYRIITDLIEQGQLGMDDLWGGSDVNGTGIIDYIIEQATARPTGPSTASSASPTSGGRRSTGRVRSQESTPSD